MIVMTDRFTGLPALQAWWPDSAIDATALLRDRAIVTVRQCAAATADDLAPYAFRRAPFHTSMIDLAQEEDELWRRLDTKSCRSEITRARRLGIEVIKNDRLDEAYGLIAGFIRKYSSPMSEPTWAALLKNADVFTAWLNENLLVAHVVLVDPPRRVRLTYSATVDRKSSPHAKAVGPANRLAHWQELVHYRELGVPRYDFGGLVLDDSSPLWSISQFKRSFGGDTVEEHTVRLARSRTVRSGLRAAFGVRRRVTVRSG